ncbi:protein KRI1 homolog [Sycon ciliatum]|uniref:protein KRI1 homolog n=1 Tax=Sycon ciliatum TaxID=27933 RepID=UPI0031F6FBD1
MINGEPSSKETTHKGFNMLAEIKDKAKRDQLKRLIAMLNDRMHDDAKDQDHDDEVYDKRVDHEWDDGKGDEYREEHDDKHPMEDLHEDEDRHHKKKERLEDDVDADRDDHEEDEEYDIKSDLKDFLGGHVEPEEIASKKAKVMYMETGKPRSGEEAPRKKRGRKKRKAGM